MKLQENETRKQQNCLQVNSSQCDLHRTFKIPLEQRIMCHMNPTSAVASIIQHNPKRTLGISTSKRGDLSEFDELIGTPNIKLTSCAVTCQKTFTKDVHLDNMDNELQKVSHSSQTLGTESEGKPANDGISDALINDDVVDDPRMKSNRSTNIILDVHPCWKITMVFSNILIMAGGVVIFVMGLWTIMDKNFMSRLLGTNLYIGMVYLLIYGGSFSVGLAVVGCVGAIRTVKCLILMYTVIILAMLISLLSASIVALLFRHWVRIVSEEHMFSLLKSYSKDRIIQDAWDTTQQNLKCCGVFSAEDWKQNGIPSSCCPNSSCSSKQSFYQSGCLDATEQFLASHITNIAAAFLILLTVILLGLLSSCGYYGALTGTRLVSRNR